MNETRSISVFPGIELVYSDFHSYGNVSKRKKYKQDTMFINYCHEGRIEWELINGKYYYLGEGDLSIHRHGTKIKTETFPLEHYHGITIILEMDKITTITPMLRSFGVNLELLSNTFHNSSSFFIERADNTVKHIFTQLYGIPEKIKDTYIKLKILELFLFLSVINTSDYVEQQQYFRKSDIEKVKHLKEYLMKHIEEHITLNALSEKFMISQTLLKSCFKSIYGMPIYSFVRGFRMQKAATLLTNTEERIAEIGLQVGYSNSSKFSAAFRDEFGLTPIEYRKKIRKNEFQNEME